VTAVRAIFDLDLLYFDTESKRGSDPSLGGSTWYRRGNTTRKVVASQMNAVEYTRPIVDSSGGTRSHGRGLTESRLPVTPGAVINLLTYRPESGIWINRTRVVVK
jgi:hypothetical protein